MDPPSFVIISFSCLFVLGLLVRVSLVLFYQLGESQYLHLVGATQKCVKQNNANEGTKVKRDHFLELSRTINSRTGLGTQVSCEILVSRGSWNTLRQELTSTFIQEL